MKKGIVKCIILIIILVIVAIAVAGYLYYKKVYYGNWIYTFEESEEMINNPYQGAYVQVNLGDPNHILEKLEFYSEHSVILLVLDLRDYRYDSVIPESKIEDLKYSLDLLKSKGLSVVFRGVYDLVGDYDDPDFEIILGHIRQIGEVINEYKDCIAGVQAGMIGAYGEWHSSDYMEDPAYYTQVISEWLGVLDAEISVGIRRQEFIRVAQEYGIDIKRLGIYNDGMFSSDTDLGTYQSEGFGREDELKWSQDTIKVPFNGGEMPFVTEFSEIDNVVKEAKQLKLSYLNRYYNTDVWDLWKTQEYMGIPGDEYLKKYLGVRPWVKQAAISKNFHKRKNINIEIKLQNSGFAILDSAWKPYILFECDGSIEKISADLDVLSQEEAVVSAKLSNTFSSDETERIRIGLMFTRGEDTTEGYWLRLANDVEQSENGIYWLIDYNTRKQDEKDGF